MGAWVGSRKWICRVEKVGDGSSCLAEEFSKQVLAKIEILDREIEHRRDDLKQPKGTLHCSARNGILRAEHQPIPRIIVL